jgi:hypothetical protein
LPFASLAAYSFRPTWVRRAFHVTRSVVYMLKGVGNPKVGDRIAIQQAG